jgi:hypothetical protein
MSEEEFLVQHANATADMIIAALAPPARRHLQKLT